MCCSKVSIILILFVMKLSDVSAQSFRSEEGPYQTVISNTSRCAKEPPWFHASLVADTQKGQSMIRGTLNFSQGVNDIMKFGLSMYYLESKKVKVFDMKNQNCHNNIIELILNTIQVPFNRQNCRVKAGFYQFNHLNLDAIIHTVVPSLWYGSVQLRVEVHIRSKPLFCGDIYYRIVKIDKETQ